MQTTDKKILVVDDDPDIADLVIATLESEGRTFAKARDGVSAVEKVFTEMPDLVILDINMPRMDGYQVCRLLKHDKSVWEIPVLMLSAKERLKDKNYGISVGADTYLTKPFQPEDLRRCVDELLARTPNLNKLCPVVAKFDTNEATLLSRVNSLLDRKLQELTFLQQITKSIVSTFDEVRIMDIVLMGINGEADYLRVAIFLADKEGSLVLRRATGFPETTEPVRLRIDNEVEHERLMVRMEPIILTGREALTGHGFDHPAGKRPFKQQCIVPIVFRKEVKGAIFVDRRENEPPFSSDRVSMLAALAGQMGMALENAELYRRMLYLSETDGLTGLYNARFFYDRVETEITRSRRYGHALSLLMLDIDHFKKFNDTYGHLGGDEALKHLARILREESRATDIVARYGGEEFGVVLPETDGENAQKLAERIRHAVESQPFDLDLLKREASLTISIGVATMPEDLARAEDLVRLADKALYRAKQGGRNRVST